ncbi:hypothetical protein AVU38_gp108 [Ralstonia phage RSL2]|nr:hypothetical protein AVU38_gp108 [Ralstonia phage RSL2]
MPVKHDARHNCRKCSAHTDIHQRVHLFLILKVSYRPLGMVVKLIIYQCKKI